MIRKIILYLILPVLSALAVIWLVSTTEPGIGRELLILATGLGLFFAEKKKILNWREAILFLGLTAVMAFSMLAVYSTWDSARIDDDSDYSGFKLILSSDNGSLPPDYHREETYAVFEKNVAGEIIAEHTTSDYNKVLKKEDLSVDRDQFNLFISQAIRVRPAEDSDSLSGCTGGSSKSLEVLNGGKVILKTSSYSCAGKFSNESLERFSSEFYDILNRIVE